MEFLHNYGEMHSGFSQVIHKMNGEVQRLGVQNVVLEGPPLYAFPDWNNTAQAWDSKPFRTGWQLTNDLYFSLKQNYPQRGITHWVLLDDRKPESTKSTPPSSGKNIIPETLATISDEFSKPLEIFTHIDYGVIETSLLETQRRTSCHEIDALFQIQKLETYMQDVTSRHALFVVVHPQSFQEQQISMLNNLYELMRKKSLYQQVSKEQRLRILKQYRHIWISSHGKIINTTYPNLTKNGQFIHVPLL